MGLSSGNAYSSSTEFHSFVTNDPKMVAVGLGSFTRDSLNKALVELKSFEDEIGDEDFFNDIKSANGSNGLQILFNTMNSGSWQGGGGSKSSNDIIGLISTFESTIEGLIVENSNDKSASVSKVKGAKKWLEANISPVKETSSRCYTLMGGLFSKNDPSVYTNLYFHIPGEGVDRQERVTAQKGSQIISDVAVSATGLKYSKSKTEAARSSLHAGVYVRPDDMSGNSINDLATGKIRLSYNDSLGSWESTQTILARLITPVAAAGNTAFQMPDEDSDGFLQNDADGDLFYSRGSEYYTGNFSSGLAVPVSAQDGNPNLFGPNIIIEYNAKRIEKIRVINRSEKSFTAGTLVMCTLIGSEWIIQEFSIAGEGLPTKMGAWTFSKLIANSDAFFRDAGMSNEMWSAGKYEYKARQNWYFSWKNSIAGGSSSMLPFHDATEIMSLNDGSNVAFNPSLGYFAASSFDSAKYIQYTNVTTAMAAFTTDALMGSHLKNWWGPSFPDGYQASLATGVNNSGPAGINSSLYFPGYSFNGPREDTPADMAVNGYYSDDNSSSPILPLDYWQSLLNSNTLYSAASQYRSEIYNSQTVMQSRGLTPANPNHIQFSPLQAEMVIQSDPLVSSLPDGAERKDIQERMNGAEGANGDSHMFGQMFSRFSSLNVGSYLPYDHHIKSTPLSKPLGTLLLYIDDDIEKEGLNLVGITAAINRFTRPGGGTVNMEVYEDFGPPMFQSALPGQAPQFSTVAAFFGVVAFTPGTAPRSIGWNQYGSPIGGHNYFGTTALHCRVFDAWPRENTIWDTRYFAALHFNSSGPEVDFPVPTLSDGSFPSAGSSVTHESGFKATSDWTKDPIRRGMLLTSGGFAYKKLTIGLSPSSMKVIKGPISAGNFLDKRGNIEMTFDSSGGVSFGSDEFGNALSGEDLNPGSFGDRYYDDSDPNNIIDETGYIVKLDGGGVVSFQGQVRYITKLDTGPKEHGGIKRLTSGTGDEAGRITGNKSTEFGLDPNDSGQYDAYFFFHNDISHTFQFQYGRTQYPGYAQYVTLNIS
jgi:hypothetical protein